MQSCSAVLFQSDDVICSHYYTLDFSTSILPHTRSSWTFLLVKSGELTYTANDNSIDIKPGSLIITPPDFIRSLNPKGSIIYDRYVFAIPEDYMDKEILDQLPHTPYVLDVSGNSMILDIFEKMVFYVSNLQPKQAVSVLRSLGNELAVNIYIATRDTSDTAESTTSPLIARLLVYISTHIREPLTVPQLSQAMSVSSGYLHQHFVKHMKMTPNKYRAMAKH